MIKGVELVSLYLMYRTTTGRISIWDIDSKRENWKITTSNERAVITVEPVTSNNVIR